MTKTEPDRARGAINPVTHLRKSVPKPTLFPNYTTASTAPRIEWGIIGSEPNPPRGVINPIVYVPKSVPEYTLSPHMPARRNRGVCTTPGRLVYHPLFGGSRRRNQPLIPTKNTRVCTGHPPLLQSISRELVGVGQHYLDELTDQL